jgi:hypothetical protein
MMPLTFIQVLQALSYCAVILGIPLALRQHYRAVKKEQRDRELAQRDRELRSPWVCNTDYGGYSH